MTQQMNHIQYQLSASVAELVDILRQDRLLKPDAALSQREKQSRFAYMTAILILFIRSNGYEVTFGESFDDDGKGHMAGSLHYIRLAQDLNLFRNGEYLTNSMDHFIFGEFWESIGGTWGGRFKSPDGNHYSLSHGGKS